MSVHLLRRAAVGVVAGAVGIAVLFAFGTAAPPVARAGLPAGCPAAPPGAGTTPYIVSALVPGGPAVDGVCFSLTGTGGQNQGPVTVVKNAPACPAPATGAAVDKVWSDWGACAANPGALVMFSFFSADTVTLGKQVGAATWHTTVGGTTVGDACVARALPANPAIQAGLAPGAHTVSTSGIDLTVCGVSVGSVAAVSNAARIQNGAMTVPQLPDDASFTYTCDAGPSTTFTIPSPNLMLRTQYKLTCPSPGGTISAPAATVPGAGDAFLKMAFASVGGVAEVPSGGAPTLSATATAGGSGLPMGAWAGIALAALAVAAAGGGAWYVRRRGLRED